MQLHVQPDGSVRCIYGELIDFSALGALQIRRASFVEPTPDGRWQADLSPSGGPVLGPFPSRSAALAAEIDWLERAGLVQGSGEDSTV